MTASLLSGLWLMATPVHAQTGIHRCTGPDGELLLTDQPCDETGQARMPSLGRISGGPVRASGSALPPAPVPAPRGQAAPTTLTHGERTRYRQMKMELEGIERQLQRGVRRDRRQALLARQRLLRQELAPLERRVREHGLVP